MAHFAIFAPPLRGHYDPLSALAEALIQRGHRATFVHHEDARRLVQAQGAGFASLGSDRPPVENWTRPMSKIRGLVGLGGTMKRMEDFTATFCREGPALLRSIGVDAIIADQLEPAGGLVADYLKIPWISIATTIPMNREMGVPPPFVSWRYDPGGRGIRRNEGGWMVSDFILRSFNRAIARNSKALGLSRRGRLEDCFSPLLQLAQAVPDLDFPRKELPPTFHYTGPFRPDDDPPLSLAPGDGRPTVLASLGTLQGSRTAIFRKVAEACDRLGLRLVITLGGLEGAKEARSLPGRPIVFDWLPQRSALGQVDLVVCHGGMNIVLDTLAAGLPMLVMPLAFEQPGIAARVARSGAGKVLRRGTSPASLALELADIALDPSFRARAMALSDQIAAAGGRARAADLIEAALGACARSAGPTRAREA